MATAPKLAFFAEGILVGLGLAALFVKALQSGVYEDTFWHLQAGTWVLDHHSLLHHQLGYFSLPASFPWHPVEWGYQVFLAEAVRLAPSAGFLIAGPALVAGALLLCWSMLVSAGCNPIARGVAIAYAGFTLSVFPLARPSPASWLLFAAEWFLLDRGATKAKAPWSVVVILAIWANVHSSFPVGVALIALQGLRRPPLRIPAKKLTALFSVSVLATLLDPYGPLAAWQGAFRIATYNQMRNTLIEWMTPNTHLEPVVVVLAIPLAGMVYALFSGKSPFARNRALVIALAVTFAGALLTANWLGYLIIVAAMSIPYFLTLGTARPDDAAAVSKSLSLSAGVVVAGLFMTAAVLPGPHLYGSAPGPNEPGAAVSWLHGQAPGAWVLSTYVWNGFLAEQGFSVYITGAADIYGQDPALYTTYLNVFDYGTSDPSAITSRYALHWAVVPPGSLVERELSREGWSVAHATKPADVMTNKVAGE